MMGNSAYVALFAESEDIVVKFAKCWCLKHNFLLEQPVECGMQDKLCLVVALALYNAPPEVQQARGAGHVVAGKRLDHRSCVSPVARG